MQKKKSRTEYGHFDEAAREYVITHPDTPAPWINYLMGGDLTAIISQTAGGLAFYKEPSEGRLTRYRFNGLPVDSPGFYLYIQDGKHTWNPSFGPTRTPLDRYECHHGLGYTRFHSRKNGLCANATYLIPPDDNVFLWSVRLTNTTGATKKVRLSTYLEFSLHTYGKDVHAYLVCGNQWRLWFDKKVNGIKSRYFAFESLFWGQCIFASTEPVKAFEIDRDQFIGHGRNESNPIGLERGLHDSEVRDGGRFASGVLQNEITIKPGQSRHVLFRYAVSDRFAESARLLKKYTTEADVARALDGQRKFWETALGAAQVCTPDSATNSMLNTWLPYNSRVTFKHGRSISTRHTGGGGALRYRDSMQDALPSVQLFPKEARERIRRILHSMFADGHCLCGVHPETLKPMGEGDIKIVRSDAAVWGVFTIYQYLAESGDFGFLDEVVPYYPDGQGTVFEHLFRSLKFIATHKGKHGLPDLFTVDWNDFLQIFTVAYTGCQSVMVAQQFIYAARLLIEIAERLGRKTEIEFLQNAIREFTQVLESDVCWDGKWFKRVLGDNLELGSAKNEDARIFVNSQSWAVIAGTLDAKKVRTAMDSVYKHLNTEWGIRIFAPSFWKMPDGSLVPTNTPGAGENGGIFVHTNTWAIMAEAMLGHGERAWEYFSKVLPANLSAKDPERYANEPYAFTSWIYGPEHERYGTGQLSWLTGGVAWMYMIGLEYILGVKPTLTGLRIDPCIPADWKSYAIHRRWRGTDYEIVVENHGGISKGNVSLTVNGKPVPGNLLLPTSEKKVAVRAVLG